MFYATTRAPDQSFGTLVQLPYILPTIHCSSGSEGVQVDPRNDCALSTSCSPLASRNISELDQFIASHPSTYVDTQTCRPALARRPNQRNESNRYFAPCDSVHYSLILPSLVISHRAGILKTGSLDCQPPRHWQLLPALPRNASVAVGLGS